MLNNLQVEALYAAASSRAMCRREWLLDALTIPNSFDVNIRATAVPAEMGKIIVKQTTLLPNNKTLGVGQVVCINDARLGIVTAVNADTDDSSVTIAVIGTKGKPIFQILDVFNADSREDTSLPGTTAAALAKLYLGVNPFTASLINSGRTTVGRFIENVVCLQYPTNFRFFEYLNKVWNPDKIMGMVTKQMVEKRITVEEYKKFLDHMFYLNHITEICVPSMTVKSLETDPRVKEVKAAFIASHQGKMHDPVVIKELEDQLAKLDNEWLGIGTDNPDPSVTFFDGLGSKSYNVHRKKLFLTTGGVPAFKEQTGEFDFIPNSLMEGWTIDALPSIANEIRKGSYERGRETAKGGAETKLVMRVFQDLAIDNDDCGTKRTIKLNFATDCRIDDFIGRTINLNGQDIEITDENKSQFDGKILDVYSPMTCATPHNLCYKCCGRHSRDLGAEVLGIQVVKITSKFMNTAMKNMHGTALQIIQPKLEDIFI